MVVAALLALGLLAGGWTVVRGLPVKGQLLRASDLVGQLERQVRAGDVTGARQTLVALRGETRSARARTGGPGWWVGGRLPVVGGDAAAVRTAARAVDDLAAHVLPPLLDAAGSVGPATLMPRQGRLDLGPVRAAAPSLAAASARLDEVRARVSSVAVDGLMEQVRTALAAFRDGLDRLAAVVGPAARVAALLPPLLGADGPRTYLVLVQNPAELRATGGMPGAFAVLRAERGTLRMVRQGSAAADLGTFDRPVLRLEPAMRQLYTDKLATFPADVNLTPHFPTAAALAREMYRRRSGQTVDGVLAIDPVALSYLLPATGPLPVPGGPKLTAAGAVTTLLSDAYLRIDDPVRQDRYFADAAKAVFDALSRGAVQPRTALAGLARAVDERRILLWSADPGEQAAVAQTAVAGVLPERDGARPTVGVFLNDGSGAKLGYYLQPAADLRITGCRPDGRREMVVRVTLRSTAPRAGLPRSVLGLGLSGDPYTVRTLVLLFSPAGGAIRTARLEGVPVPIGTGAERGRAVGVVTMDVPAGASRTVEATLLTDPLPLGEDAAVSPELWLTPAATAWRRSAGPEHICRLPR
jgi:hypothetical protein